jgi:hypothetical protein
MGIPPILGDIRAQGGPNTYVYDYSLTLQEDIASDPRHAEAKVMIIGVGIKRRSEVHVQSLTFRV